MALTSLVISAPVWFQRSRSTVLRMKPFAQLQRPEGQLSLLLLQPPDEGHTAWTDLLTDILRDIPTVGMAVGAEKSHSVLQPARFLPQGHIATRGGFAQRQRWRQELHESGDKSCMLTMKIGCSDKVRMAVVMSGGSCDLGLPSGELYEHIAPDAPASNAILYCGSCGRASPTSGSGRSADCRSQSSADGVQQQCPALRWGSSGSAGSGNAAAVCGADVGVEEVEGADVLDVVAAAGLLQQPCQEQL